MQTFKKAFFERSSSTKKKMKNSQKARDISAILQK